MHASDRTMLARLGFNDPDKKNPLHDIACAYICQPEIATKLATKVFGHLENTIQLTKQLSPECKCEWTGHLTLDKTMVSCVREKHVLKGSGQYATTIGFLDVVLTRQWSYKATGSVKKGTEKYWPEQYRLENRREAAIRECTANHKLSDYGLDLMFPRERYDGYDGNGLTHRKLIVEVKASQETEGDILRQINLYRQYCTAQYWVVATLFDIGKITKDSLTSAGIVCVRIGGQSFQEFCSKFSEQAVDTFSL